MTFYWHFERATCGGAPPTALYVNSNTTTGGADLLATAGSNDMVLLLLAQTRFERLRCGIGTKDATPLNDAPESA